MHNFSLLACSCDSDGLQLQCEKRWMLSVMVLVAASAPALHCSCHSGSSGLVGHTSISVQALNEPLLLLAAA